MMKTDFQIFRVKNADLSEAQRAQLISLKQQRWPYDEPSQRRWLAENLEPDDLHFFLQSGGELLSYLDAVRVRVDFSGRAVSLWGVGNVCTAVSRGGHGLASALQAGFRQFLTTEHAGGILLCKDALVPFYEKNGWLLLQPAGVTVAGSAFFHRVMVMNTAEKTDGTICIARSF